MIVVLFSLTILTLIFGTATSRTMAHLERVRTDAVLAQRLHDGVRMAELVMQVGLDPEGGARPAVFEGVRLQPVTGLVDLNTASPALLRLLLEGYGLPDATIREGLEQYRAWRRQGRKLLRVNDFLRVTGLDAAMLPGLEQLATVTSGRTGIAPEQAPLALLQHLFGPEDRAILVGRMAPELVSPGTVVNRRVVGDGTSVTVHFGGPARVLAVR